MYQIKYEESLTLAGRHEYDLCHLKTKISELNRSINHLQTETEKLQDQRATLEAAITDAEQHGETSIKPDITKLAELEADPQWVKQLQEYKELMNLKLVLDIEIVIYCKLL